MSSIQELMREAEALIGQGQDLHAEAIYSRILALQKLTLKEAGISYNNPAIATTLLNMASLHVRRNNFNAAEAWTHSALSCLARAAAESQVLRERAAKNLARIAAVRANEQQY